MKKKIVPYSKTKQYKREYYRKNKERFSQNRKHTKAYKRQQERTKYLRKYIVEYREAQNSRIRRWYAKNKLRKIAHNKISKALYWGRISRQKCEICGAIKTHAHHEDYAKPDIVIWLCPRHHSELHSKNISFVELKESWKPRRGKK